jgi:hypothetical protein
MEVDAGTVVLGLVLDTLSGRSPLYPTFRSILSQLMNFHGAVECSS